MQSKKAELEELQARQRRQSLCRLQAKMQAHFSKMRQPQIKYPRLLDQMQASQQYEREQAAKSEKCQAEMQTAVVAEAAAELPAVAELAAPEEITVFDFDYDNCVGGLSCVCQRTKRVIEGMDRFHATFPGQFADRQALFDRSFEEFVKPLADQPGRKLVMCGSARQDITSDKWNRKKEDKNYDGFPHFQHDTQKKEGLVTTELPCLAKQLGAELYPLLFADGDGKAGLAWEDESRTMYQCGPAAHRWHDLKAPLLRFQIDRLQQHLGEGVPFHIYFFDDRVDILQEVVQRVKVADETAGWRGLPEGVKLTCIHMDWFETVHGGCNGLKVYDADDGISGDATEAAAPTPAPTHREAPRRGTSTDPCKAPAPTPAKHQHRPRRQPPQARF